MISALRVTTASRACACFTAAAWRSALRPASLRWRFTASQPSRTTIAAAIHRAMGLSVKYFQIAASAIRCPYFSNVVALTMPLVMTFVPRFRVNQPMTATAPVAIRAMTTGSRLKSKNTAPTAVPMPSRVVMI